MVVKLGQCVHLKWAATPSYCFRLECLHFLFLISSHTRAYANGCLYDHYGAACQLLIMAKSRAAFT